MPLKINFKSQTNKLIQRLMQTNYRMQLMFGLQSTSGMFHMKCCNEDLWGWCQMFLFPCQLIAIRSKLKFHYGNMESSHIMMDWGLLRGSSLNFMLMWMGILWKSSSTLWWCDNLSSSLRNMAVDMSLSLWREQQMRHVKLIMFRVVLIEHFI